MFKIKKLKKLRKEGRVDANCLGIWKLYSEFNKWVYLSNNHNNLPKPKTKTKNNIKTNTILTLPRLRPGPRPRPRP